MERTNKDTSSPADVMPGLSGPRMIRNALGPKQIKDYWPATTMAGFSRIDGAVAIHGMKGELCFFFGPRVIGIKFSPGVDDTFLEGPSKLATNGRALPRHLWVRLMPQPIFWAPQLNVPLLRNALRPD